MKRLCQIFFIILILACLQTIYAQGPAPPAPDPPTGGGVEDVFPINFLVYPFILLGAFIGYRYFKNSTK